MGRSGYSEPCAGETGSDGRVKPHPDLACPCYPLASPMMTAVVWGAVFLLS